MTVAGQYVNSKRMKLGQRLFWTWRLCATALSFFVFGCGGVLLPLLVIPVLYLLPGDQSVRERRLRWVVHILFKAFIYFMRGLGLLTWEIADIEKIRRPGILVLANHPTLLDIVFLVAFIPDANCIVKSRLFSNPAMRGVISQTGYITNGNGANLISDANSALQSGSALVIFPEGTRTGRDGKFSLQRGAANIATRCCTDVTPVIIRCNPPTLSKEHMWYHIPHRPFVLSFDIRDDIQIAPYLVDSASLGARKLTRYLEQYFSTELK